DPLENLIKCQREDPNLGPFYQFLATKFCLLKMSLLRSFVLLQRTISSSEKFLITCQYDLRLGMTTELILSTSLPSCNPP
ncbi:hypothetical protein, partial [Pseudoalteromonas sp.]|uniref:hypothetical protein n=1 Tax=Pseudoalteromonas sp. TaxID=53249 RepID=UPI002601BF89